MVLRRELKVVRESTVDVQYTYAGEIRIIVVDAGRLDRGTEAVVERQTELARVSFCVSTVTEDRVFKK